MPPVTTSVEPGIAVSARGDQAARARLRGRQRPAELAAAVEHDLLHPAPVGRVEVPPQALRQRRLELEQPRLGARLGHEVDVDLEAARADRHLEPVAVAAGLLEGLRDLRLAGAEEAQRPPQRRRAPVEHAAHVGGFERPRPEPLQLRRRPGQHDHRRPVRVDDEAGRGAGEAEDRRGLGHGRLLGDPVREVRVRPLHPLRDHARDALDLPLQLRVDAHAQPGDLRHDRDGAVVVGRAEPAGRRDEIRGATASATAASSSAGSSPTTWIRVGSTPSASRERARNGPFRSVRSPRTSSLPVTTMTARGRAPFAPVKPRRPRRSSSPSRRRPAP